MSDVSKIPTSNNNVLKNPVDEHLACIKGKQGTIIISKNKREIRRYKDFSSLLPIIMTELLETIETKPEPDCNTSADQEIFLSFEGQPSIGDSLNPYLKYQLLRLQTAENEIARDARALARNICIDHLDYATLAEKKDKLFSTIDDVKKKYELIFSFHIHYHENRRLDIMKSDVNEWIKNGCVQHEDD